jgi:ubiquinone/menaquinone biosynthesis C-methylase UbiE
MSRRVHIQASAQLVRRVNQLYHDLTQPSFDHAHRYRHRSERPFWHQVAEIALAPVGSVSSSPREPLRVMDLACGSGFVLETLTPHLTDGDMLIAADLSHAALRSAAGKWRALMNTRTDRIHLHLLVCDAQRLPLAAESIDLIALNASLHHFPDPVATLREIDRLLRPGGHFALGFEPNRTHFESTVMTGLARCLTRTSWYMSPRENWRRFRERINDSETTRPDTGDDVLARTMNEQLASEGLIARPLDTETLLDLVDSHARGAVSVPGFDQADLLRRAMPAYEVRRLYSSDYLGETGRRMPAVRRLVDTIGRAVIPQHGSLFSWLIRKPGTETA